MDLRYKTLALMIKSAHYEWKFWAKKVREDKYKIAASDDMAYTLSWLEANHVPEDAAKERVWNRVYQILQAVKEAKGDARDRARAQIEIRAEADSAIRAHLGSHPSSRMAAIMSREIASAWMGVQDWLIK